jgi:hypothetical protein
MAKNTGDPRGPGMPGSGGWFPTPGKDAQEPVLTRDPEQVDLSFDEWTPQRPSFVHVGDTLVVMVSTSFLCTLALTYRVLRPDGQVIVSQETLKLSGGEPHFFTFNPPTGILLSVSLWQLSGFINDEFMWGCVYLSRPVLGQALPMEILCGGYITLNVGISYPNGGFVNGESEQGNISSRTINPPGAGNDFIYATASFQRDHLWSIVATLTTSATVANRTVQLVVDDGAAISFISPTGVAQAASLAWTYCWGAFPFATLQQGTNQWIFMDNTLRGFQGFRWRSVTTNLQVGDVWSSMKAYRECWVYF